MRNFALSVVALAVLGIAQSSQASTLTQFLNTLSCSERVIDHGGTIDSSCQARGYVFGCYDVVETTCENDNGETSRRTEQRMNGECGHSYSDCW